MNSGAALPPPDGGSLLHRINHTPLRDVLRGRISGRLDVVGIIAESGLPSSLSKIVDQTVRRTRLWRIEKADVAHELVAHFQDGIAAGATEDAIAKSFGDAPNTARLIRRAKRRARPKLVKAFLWSGRATASVFGLFLVAYTWFAIRLYVSEPNVTRDYIAEYNAKALAVPKAERAWPLYRQAYRSLGGPDSDPPLGFHAARPGGPYWEECASFAEAHNDTIELYRKAAARHRCAWVMNDPEDLCPPLYFSNVECDTAAEGSGLMWVVIPPLGTLMGGAYLLSIDAYQAMLASDSERAVRDVETILRMVEHASEAPQLAWEVFAYFLLNRGCGVVGRLLHHFPELFADKDLMWLSHRLASVRGGGPLRLHLDGEIALFHDFVQRNYSDDGHGDGYLIGPATELLPAVATGDSATPIFVASLIDGFLAPVMTAVVAGRREIIEKHERHMNLVAMENSLPLWQRGESQADREAQQLQSGLSNIRFTPLDIFLGSFSGTSRDFEFATQERDAVLSSLTKVCSNWIEYTDEWPWIKSVLDEWSRPCANHSSFAN